MDDSEPEEQEPKILSLPDDLLMECLTRLSHSSINPLTLVSHRFYELLESPSYYELRRNVCRLESLLFVFGGAGTGRTSAVYSKSNGGWRASSVLNTDSVKGNEWYLDYHRAGNSLLYAKPVILNQQIFIPAAIPCRSSHNGDCTIVYNAWTMSFTSRAPMLCPKKKFACCVISNRIFVAGGAHRNDSTSAAIANAEEYIPEFDEWKPIANMPQKRYGCLGAAVNGIFYVIGGFIFGNMDELSYLSSMDSFDTKTNTWLKTKALPIEGRIIACTVVGSCIYVLSRHAVELSFWKYVTDADSWTRIEQPPIPAPLSMDNVVKFNCVTMGSLVYIIQVGGSIDDLSRRSESNAQGLKEGLVLVYDTELQEWEQGPNLAYLQNGAACAVVEC